MQIENCWGDRIAAIAKIAQAGRVWGMALEIAVGIQSQFLGLYAAKSLESAGGQQQKKPDFTL
jgi:hypothetical protein